MFSNGLWVTVDACVRKMRGFVQFVGLSNFNDSSAKMILVSEN